LEQTRHVGVAKSEHPKLTNGEIIFEEFQPIGLCDHNPPTLQTDDRQTTCDACDCSRFLDQHRPTTDSSISLLFVHTYTYTAHGKFCLPFGAPSTCFSLDIRCRDIQFAVRHRDSHERVTVCTALVAKCRRELVACVGRCIAVVLVVRGRRYVFLFRSGQLNRVADRQPRTKECYVVLEDCSTSCHRRVTRVRRPAAAVVCSADNSVSWSSGSVQRHRAVLVNLSSLL